MITVIPNMVLTISCHKCREHTHRDLGIEAQYPSVASLVSEWKVLTGVRTRYRSLQLRVLSDWHRGGGRYSGGVARREYSQQGQERVVAGDPTDDLVS